MKSQSQDEEAIHIFNEYIPEMLEEKKDIWAQKSRKFQNEYKDPSYPYYTDLDGRTQKYSKKELISIRAKNKRMTQAVLTAKRNYESFQKYDALWNEIKEKYQ
ncbi:MAG: hypothetical protein PHS82_03195 [Lachnospiraceae bacterium]|nr:hypothetical protein [Lachnospiraceae bacterium]